MSTPPLDRIAPPNPSGLPASTPPPVETTVSGYQIVLAGAVAGAVAGVMPMWASIPTINPFTWWYSGGSASPANKAFILMSTAQETAALASRQYVLDVMAAQGTLIAAPRLNALALAGVASDGRDVDKLLEQPVWAMWGALRTGASPAEARAAGATTMMRILHTQVMDAAREAQATVIAASDVLDIDPAILDDYETDFQRSVDELLAEIDRQANPDVTSRDQVLADALRILQDEAARELVREAERETRRAARARERDQMYQRRTELGWTRVLTPPSCGRCIALAGRWYRWSDDFQRHTNCDCVQVPSASAREAEPLLVDPNLYFESLTPVQQDDAFGVAAAEAIRAGADISQVVNAYRKGSLFTVDGRTYTREGTTKRGGYKRTEGGKAGALRATPTTIIQAANGDRAEAARLLKRFGYIT